MDQQEAAIFKQGSTTYFMSSLFFPAKLKKDVADLYSFVRVADDYVDSVPANTQGFTHLRALWEVAVVTRNFDTTKLPQDSTDDRVVKNMLRLTREYNFDTAWVAAFLDSMQSDLQHEPCHYIEDTLRYTYGSAEVIGLMMARIMGLPSDADQAAKMQGRAMQMINFIRDIQEDNQLKRLYLPQDELYRFGLNRLTKKEAYSKPVQFEAFIRFQIERYQEYQKSAQSGHTVIPKRLRIPLSTATDAYNWTAKQIYKNPYVVFAKKVKPSKLRLLVKVAKHSIT